MTLVRGSKDRLKLEWSAYGTATGPDGYSYSLQSEHVRGESRVYWASLPDRETEGCPYGYIGTVNDAKRVCEWHAWVRAGRPTS